MQRRRLVWHICPAYLVITLLSVWAVAWYASDSWRRFYDDRLAEDLEDRARFLAHQLARHTGDEPSLADVLRAHLNVKQSMRVSLISPQGRVLYDNRHSLREISNQHSRPEVERALQGTVGRQVRSSEVAAGARYMFVAVPVPVPDAPALALRVGLPTTLLDNELQNVRVRISGAVLLVALIAGLLGVFFAYRISQPLWELRQGAERFAKGDLGRKLPVHSSVEIGGLAQAMNKMSSELDARIRTIVEQRNELEAVLSSMMEGVLAVDTEERLISLNSAAAELLQIDREGAGGKSIQEVVRNADLLRFIGRALAEETPVIGDVVLRNQDGSGDRHLRAHGTALRDTEGHRIGALVVMDDVTRLRRLETIRRDFVSNVSHEIRTPITTIKGFVETLMDGAIEDADQARHFLTIVGRQAERLNAIVNDLLSLSQIEADNEHQRLRTEVGELRPVLESAVQVCRRKAAEQQMTIDLDCPADINASISPQLLEQAVTNLLDNAIKYSGSQNRIEVRARCSDDAVTIAVQDWGCGIAREYQPRLFERFYRVDKGRSRRMGGTGLGLSIVKHIIQVHGGSVSVASEPGQGSTFTLHLPPIPGEKYEEPNKKLTTLTCS